MHYFQCHPYQLGCFAFNFGIKLNPTHFKSGSQNKAQNFKQSIKAFKNIYRRD